MRWVLEAHLLVPHLEDAPDPLLGRHREPERRGRGLHLLRVLRYAADPFATALLGPLAPIVHGRSLAPPMKVRRQPRRRRSVARGTIVASGRPFLPGDHAETRRYPTGSAAPS